MLYLIKSGKYLKIGYTDNLEQRLQEYNIHNPNYSLLDTCYGTLQDEQKIHKIINTYRYKNEWFHYSNKILTIWNQCKTILNREKSVKGKDLSKIQIIEFLEGETKYIKALEFIKKNKEFLNLKNIFIQICSNVYYNTGTISAYGKFKEINNLFRINSSEFRRIINLLIKFNILEGNYKYFVFSKKFLKFNESNSKESFIKNVKNMLK